MTGLVIHIVDGDTFDLVDADQVKHRIRPTGSNAPERGKPFYDEATQSLTELASGRTVTVDRFKVDRYGRKVGVARVDDLDLCLEQVRRGLAVWFRKYAREQTPEARDEFEAAKQMARASRLGLCAN